MFARMVRASILHNGPRLAVALAAVLVPAALVTAVANFVLDARAKMRHELRRHGPNLVVMGDVEGGVRRTLATAQVGDLEVPLIGIDAAARELYPGWRVEGRWGVLVGARLAERLGLEPGMHVLDRPIDGILETGEAEDDAILVPRDPAVPVERTDLSVPGTVEDVEAFASRLAARGLDARVQRRLAESDGALLGKLTLAFVLVALLVGAVSALSMALALAAAVANRRREFGLLRALGAGNSGIARLMAAEVGVLLAVGLAAGAVAGLGLSQWLGHAVFGQGVAVRPAALGAAALACIVVAVAGAVVPLRRALAVDPAGVLKEE